EVWSAEDGKQILAVALSADGGVAASVNVFEEARVWKDGRARSLGRVGNIEPKVALSPDGLRVVTVDRAAPLTAWDAESGRALFALKEATPLCFDPAGRRLLVAHDGQAKFLDAGTGAAVGALSGPTENLSCAAFDRTGRRLVTGGKD